MLAQDAQGQWQTLDVWDEPKQSTSGGWSDDGKLLYARLPPSKKGFPTAATASMAIQDLLTLTPSYVPVKLVRANDTAAPLSEYLSDGAETVGTYVLEVHPQVLEVTWAPVCPGVIHAA